MHSLFADALRLKLRRQAAHQVPDLRRKAARWLQRHGTVPEAARQAVTAGDWPLAASVAVSELAIGAIIDPLAGEPLAALFGGLPADAAGDAAAAGLVAAAMAVREQRDEAATSWLSRAEGILGRHRPDTVIPCRLAAAEIRFALARRHGDLGSADAACAEAQALLARLPGDVLARHPEVRTQVLLHRGVVEMWTGRLAEAAGLLDKAASAAGNNCDVADYVGQRALAEAARGRLGRAAELASAAVAPASARHGAPCTSAAAEVALAWTCVERSELGEADRQLARAESVLRARPDKLIGAVAGLVTARQLLARNNPRAAVETAQWAGSLDVSGEPVTFEAVAKRAGVSRSWLYAQPDLRAEIERLRAAHHRAPASPVPAGQRASGASLLRRLEAANARVRQLAEENRRLRDLLAGALGERRAGRITTGQA